MADQYGTTATMPYAIDETGMIFGPPTGNSLYAGVLAFTDASHPGAMIPDPSLESFAFSSGNICPAGATQVGGGPFPPAPSVGLPNAVCIPSPFALSSTFGLAGQGFDQASKYSLFVGPPPASTASEAATAVSVYSMSELDFVFPPSPPNNLLGAVNLTLTRPDGWYQVIPEGFSYGPTLLFADPTGIPPSGGTTISIFGYFLVAPTVTIGGKPANVISSGVYTDNTNGIFPLQQLQIAAPAASPGPADVSVTTAMGTATLPGLQYLNSAQVFPIVGALGGIFYDQLRHRLYISNTDHNRVEIFNLSTQALLTPISVGNAPTNLSLTPDGMRLAVLNSTDGTISVIDPVQLTVLATYPGFTAQDRTNCNGATPLGSSAATIEPHRELIAFGCPYVAHVLNLDTGEISCAGIAGCDSTGTILNAGFIVAALASSADGSKVFMTSGSSPVALLDLTQNTLTPSIGVQNQAANAAIDGDDNLFASNLAIYNLQVVPVNLPSGVGYFNNSTQGDLGGGEVFNASGSLLFLPSSGVDVFDVHQGRLALRVALPDSPTVPKTPSLTVDETGSTICAIRILRSRRRNSEIAIKGNSQFYLGRSRRIW
jgi:DNA-binding beta-propeller fold protein YncE